MRELLSQPVRELSLGERMKMELIAALLHSPEVLFLDEPTIGLDVVAQHNIQVFLKHYQQARKVTILLTSHYMKDVLALCRRVVIIALGQIVYDGSLSGIIDRFGGHKIISLQMLNGEVPANLERYGELLRAEPPRVKLRVDRSVVPEVLASILANHAVVDVSVEDPPLEEVIAEMFTQFPMKPTEVLPLITKITGQLVALHDDTLTLKIDAFEYEVLIPEFTRRQLQSELNQAVSLHTIEYVDGNPMQGRMTPRLIGFLSEVEREFFELFCSVDGVGVKKALRAMVRPVKEVATAIEEQDAKSLSGLPGIGPAMAERIIAKLRRKVPKFALMVARDEKHEAAGRARRGFRNLRSPPLAGPFARAKPGGCWTRPSRRRRSSKTCRA